MWPSNSFSPSLTQNATYSVLPSASPSVSATISQIIYVTASPTIATAGYSPSHWFDSLAGYQQMLVTFAMLAGGCLCFVLLYYCFLKLTNPANVSKPVITKNAMPIGRGYEHQNVRTLFSEV